MVGGMVAYFCMEERRCIVREGVRPRKLVDEDVVCLGEVAGRGRESLSKGSDSSSTGEGSISCIGMAEIEPRESSWESGRPVAEEAMSRVASECADESRSAVLLD